MTEVVVTGLGVLCATAADPSGFATALRAGHSGLRWRGDELAADLPDFDLPTALAARVGLPEDLRRTALRMAGRAPLPIQAAVTVALQGWESAGLHVEPVPGERVGLVVGGHNLGGAYTEQVRGRYLKNPAYLPARYALHYLDTDHVGTVSQLLGITGEGFTVGGASASGNVAIINGCRLVAAGQADVCLVLGALTDLSDLERQAFGNLGAMALGDRGSPPATQCRPFDRDRRGFVAGQAAGCLVLESASSARRRGMPALAAVTGYALRLDGNRLADPDATGEAWVMAEALRRAGVEPAEVDYVNSHGTGSRLGDPTEVAALRVVFGEHLARPWINATKGLIGHGLCAAGVVEAVATVVQVRDGFVHPNANLAEPIDAGCRFASRTSIEAPLRVAMSNGFGFGGFNTSVVLAAAGG